MCRFLQGPETDQETVQKIRDAIREQREITVQLINYTKSGELLYLESLKCKYTENSVTTSILNCFLIAWN